MLGGQDEQDEFIVFTDDSGNLFADPLLPSHTLHEGEESRLLEHNALCGTIWDISYPHNHLDQWRNENAISGDHKQHDLSHAAETNNATNNNTVRKSSEVWKDDDSVPVQCPERTPLSPENDDTVSDESLLGEVVASPEGSCHEVKDMPKNGAGVSTRSRQGQSKGSHDVSSRHRMIEKKYRNKLDSSLQDLRAVVPTIRDRQTREAAANRILSKGSLTRGLKSTGKLNKATICIKAAEYIKHLESKFTTRDVFNRLQRLEADHERMRLELDEVKATLGNEEYDSLNQAQGMLMRG